MLPVVDLVAGARPNFMKLAPVQRALAARPQTAARIVHTGQHYDPAMNDVFFAQLGIPAPDVHLEVGSGSHGAQTARILERYEQRLLDDPPAAVVVFGDVNSTVACALAAAKLQVPVCHVEAGLRSFDNTMPEEINRRLTDALSDLLLVTEPSAVRNLQREGVETDRIREVGNVMIDTLAAHIEGARALPRPDYLSSDDFGVVTMHRPSNVDDPEVLRALVTLLEELSGHLDLVLPLHPRTRAALESAEIFLDPTRAPRLRVVDPLPYEESLSLLAAARVVLTDSGGIQEETSWLGIPCLTLRDNTERPVTLERGTSRLVGNDPARIREAFAEALSGAWPAGEPIDLWDGRAAERVADEIVAWMTARSGGSR